MCHWSLLMSNKQNNYYMKYLGNTATKKKTDDILSS